MIIRFPSIFFACLLMFAGFAHTRDYWKVGQGASTMKILSMPTEPRQAALAGSGIASPRSPGEALRNPLAGASADLPTLNFSKTNFSDLVGANRVSMIAHSIFGDWHLNAGMEALNYDEIQGYTDDGLTADGLSFSSGTIAAQLGIARKFNSLSAGMNARYANQNIDMYYERGFLLDGGFSYAFSDRLAFGAVFNNLGWISSGSAELSEDETNEIAPLSFQAGITLSYPMLLGFTGALSTDLFRRNDSETEFRAGAELMYKELFSLRFGMPFSADNENNALSAGVAVKIGSVTAEYAYQNRVVLEANHIFGIGIEF